VTTAAHPNSRHSQSGGILRPAILALAGVVVLGWLFPPVHFHSLKKQQAEVASATFNPTNFAAAFWSGRLLPARDRAADVEKVVATIRTNPTKVREQFGHTVGLSSSYFLFVRGVGHVVSADADSIGLSLPAAGTNVEVTVPLGFVFGNAVRDGCGLLDASGFPNAQQFNDISAALDRIVETQVLPEFQKLATLGKTIQFAGCVEVTDEDQDLKPLKLVPISVAVE